MRRTNSIEIRHSSPYVSSGIKIFVAVVVLLGLLYCQNLLRFWCNEFFDNDFLGTAPSQSYFVKFLHPVIFQLIPVIFILLYIRFGEGRKISSAGFVMTNVYKSLYEYLIGATIGFLLIAAATGLVSLT